MIQEFIKTYSEKGFHFAFSLCGDREEAKEMVQESFCRVLSKWDQFDPAMRLDNWFMAILRNLYYDGIKRYEKKHGSSLDYGWDKGYAENLADQLPDPNEMELLDRLEREEEDRFVRAAMDELNIEQKAVLSLCDLHGLSYVQAAEVLGCAEGTVKSRLSRARSALKEKIIRKNREGLPYAV